MNRNKRQQKKRIKCVEEEEKKPYRKEKNTRITPTKKRQKQWGKNVEEEKKCGKTKAVDEEREGEREKTAAKDENREMKTMLKKWKNERQNKNDENRWSKKQDNRKLKIVKGE
ncbi:hypothetical protein RUM43_009357 [Polyplax serrata]|uniref:Uncharacterized protein n=1 Tax=Polyplax serrata TaxID=468196 RepID=A0AAN8NVB0_POLSC